MILKKCNDSKNARPRVTLRAVPLLWLIALSAILAAPWFGKAANNIKPLSPDRADILASPHEQAARSGKWGDLTLVPIVLSPPMELVSIEWGFKRQPTWFFPGMNEDRVVQALQSVGVSATDAARLRAEAGSEPRIAGVVIKPDPSWVRSLTPETRARIYNMLPKGELNSDQTRPFKYPGSSLEDWLSPGLVSETMRRLVEPLIYRDGRYMVLSDIELIRSEIGSEDDLRRLAKALLRQPTVMARLSVGPTADLNALVEYWGRGGRRTKIRPLLESAAESGGNGFIDVIHLLPSFAQSHLYCYPTFSDAELNNLALANCIWTSLNFFLPAPDNRFLDFNVALKTLKEDYFIVKADFELGDIVAFLDGGGNVFHTAVYIADDLLFTKNGISAMAPWTLMSIEDVKDYYRSLSEKPVLLVHRRKSS